MKSKSLLRRSFPLGLGWAPPWVLACWVAALAVGMVLPCAAQSGEASASAKNGEGNANDKEKAIAHFRTALERIGEGNYGAAAAELERSLALYPSKNALFNLGNSYQALHRYVDALAVYERLERDYGDDLKSELREALDKQLAAVRELVVRLRVEVNPPEAKLTLNGNPLALRETVLDPGTYLVRATHPGYQPAEQRVELSPGEAETVTLDLETAVARVEILVNVEGANIELDGALVGPAPLKGPVEVTPGPHEVSVHAEGYHSYERSFEAQDDETVQLAINLESDRPPMVYEAPRLKASFWVAAGVTVVAAGASATGFILAAERDEKLQNEVTKYDAYPGNTSQVTLDRSFRRIGNLQEQRQTFETIGWVGAGVAAVGAMTSLALGWSYFFAKKPDGVGDDLASDQGWRSDGPQPLGRTRLGRGSGALTITWVPTMGGMGGRF